MADRLPGFRRSGINVLWMWCQNIAGMLVMLVITPIITNHFGLELMGVWLLVSQYVQHLMLLEMGLNTSLSRFLARSRAKGDLAEASDFLSASFFSLFAMGLLVILVSPLLAKGFDFSFESPSGTGSQVFWLVLMASLTVGLSLPLRTGIGMLSSMHRFDRLAMWETLTLIARLVLVLVCFRWFDPNLLLLAAITFVPVLIGNLMVFLDGRAANRGLNIRLKRFSREMLFRMLSISGATIVITLSAVMVRQSTPMMVGYTLGAAQVALLAFPILIVSAVMPFLGVANRLIAPVASHLDAQSRQDALYSVNVNAGRYVFSLSLLALLGLYLLGYPLLYLWLSGPKVEDAALRQMAHILLVLFAGFALATPGFVLRSVLVAGGRHWQAAKAEFLGSLVGVATGFLLMLGTPLGVTGMAIGIFLAFVVRGMGFLAVRGSQYFGKPYLRLLMDSMGRPFLVAGAAALAAKLPMFWLAADAGVWLTGGAAFSAAALLWSAGVWFWIIDPEHKEKIMMRLHKRVLKKGG